jgi:hypothetical protein
MSSPHLPTRFQTAFECSTGAQLWAVSPEPLFGVTSVMAADGFLYVSEDTLPR